MKVSKRGNGLAVRLPSKVVKKLELREGDEIEIFVENTRSFGVRKRAPSEITDLSTDASVTHPNQ